MLTWEKLAHKLAATVGNVLSVMAGFWSSHNLMAEFDNYEYITNYTKTLAKATPQLLNQDNSKDFKTFLNW